MPDEISLKRSDIEATLNQISMIVQSTELGVTTDTEMDINIAEIISLFKTIPGNINYKIEALHLVISELLKKHEFDQADKAFSQYHIKLTENFKEIEDKIEQIRIYFFTSSEKLDPNQKLYEKRVSAFEKDWKNQKKQILDSLKDLKKQIDTEFDQWIAQFKQKIDTNIAEIKKYKNETLKKFSKFPELLEQKDFSNADKILQGSKKRTHIFFDKQKEELKKIPSDIHPILKNSISYWEDILDSTAKEIPETLSFHTQTLYRSMVDEQISKLELLFLNSEQKISNFKSLLEKRMLIMADEVLIDIQEEIKQEFISQRELLDYLKPKVSEMDEELFWRWQKKLTNLEITIQTKISLLKKGLETLTLKENIDDLDNFTEECDEKISSLTDAISKDKFINAEKEIETLKKDFLSKFKQQEKLIIVASQEKNISSETREYIEKWKLKLEQTKTQLQDSISNLEDTFIKRHIPHLLSKVEKFITQNVELLNNLLDDYHTKAMKYIESHFNRPLQISPTDIHQLLTDQKKIITQELKNKKEHVELVFGRYEAYPLEKLKTQWESTLKIVHSRFNEIQKNLLTLVEERDQLNEVLDNYYELAKPAYGYKVLLKTLSQNMDIPLDQLENMLVDLISHKIISGEIDPVTKVIVLAPRVAPEQAKKRLLQVRCMVCNLIIDPTREEIIHCPHCNSPAHRAHLIEWIKIKSTCPNCKRPIKML